MEAGRARGGRSATRFPSAQGRHDLASRSRRQSRPEPQVRTASVTRQRNTGQAEVSCSHRDFERATTPRRQRESQLHPGLLSLPPPHSTMTVVVMAATDQGTSTNPSASRVTIPATQTATVTELDATRSHQNGNPWLRIERANWMALHHMTAASPPPACDTSQGCRKTSMRSDLAFGDA
jgi:hypothetical protein